MWAHSRETASGISTTVDILADVRHEAQYTSILRATGVTDVQRRDASITSPFFAVVSLGHVRPFVLVGRKPPASS